MLRAFCGSALIAFAVLFPAALPVAALAPPGGYAGTGRLFVPNSRVPLSEFVPKNGFTAVMHVEPAILSWIAAQPNGKVQVAVRSISGSISIVNATSVVGDTVTLTSSQLGDCVVVSNKLTHVLSAGVTHSIVTHWDGVGDGTWSFGATDGIGVMDYDPVTGEEVNTGSSIQDNDPGFPYVWRVDDYSLFSDGSGDPAVEAALAPDFERYIAEAYSLNAPTNLRAVALSDHVREATGWPIAHRNGVAGLLDGLPVFQVVHSHLVDIGDLYPAITGDENSLATLILPPGWTSQADADTYPILFNGFYDNMGSTFTETGKQFFESIGEVYNASGQTDAAVGLLWNGGGAAVTTTLHRSAYDNVAQLFADAASLLRADAQNIVMVGGSRGGTTAIAMGSNPFAKPYRAAYIDADAGQVAISQAIERYVHAGYQLAQGSLQYATGYKGSWRSDWVVPAGEPHAGMSRNDFCRLVLFGMTDPAELDAKASADSTLFRTRLEADDPVVILGMPSHDFSRPFVQLAEYANHLDSLTRLTVLCNVQYRFGHTSPDGVGPTQAELLQRVFIEKAGGTPPPLTNNPEGVEVRYWATDPADHTVAIPIDPPHMPAILELPLATGSEQDFTILAIGEPGATVAMWQAPLLAGWQPGDCCCGQVGCAGGCCTATNGSCLFMAPYPTCFAAAPVPVLSTTLSAGPVFGTFVLDVDPATPLAAGQYWYELYYGPEGGTTPQLGQGDMAIPGGDQPLMRVMAADEIFGAQVESRTGGLAGDALHLP